jgi:peptidoglycan/LPS O-acetylase OafA/YrhL
LVLRFSSRETGRRVLIGVLLTAPVFRLLSIQAAPAFNFLMFADSLGTGCLLALLQDRLLAWPPYGSLFSSRWMTLVPVLAVAGNFIPSTKVTWILGEPMMNVSIALCVHWLIMNPKSELGRFFNLPWLASIGVLSYSIYLWQQIFTHHGNLPGEASAFPLNLVWMTAAALASYLLVEGPCLRLRSRMEAAWERRAGRLSILR